MKKFRQNIFGIGEVYELQKEGQWIDRTRESYREYGYFGGGTPVISVVNRIDYSNDTQTASVRGPLSLSRIVLAATGNSNFGYFGGGYAPGSALTIVDRIDYSNDSQTASVRGPLSLARFFVSATGNSNFGYFGGGRTTIPTPSLFTSIVDRINYSNDLVTATVRGPLSLTRGYTSSGGNSNFGYFAGGRIAPGPTYYSTIDRTNYSNDTSINSVRGSLTVSRDCLGFAGNSSYGWLFGGTQPYYSRIERIDYSNDLVLPSIRNVLSSAKSYGSANGNSNFGFYGGGFTPSAPQGSRSTMERIDYANDTNALSIRGPLSSVRYNLASTSSASFGGSPVSYLGAPWVATAPYGYFSGAALGALDRVDYTNDTAATTLRSQLSDTRRGLAATGNNNFGYYGGGYLPAPSVNSTVDRIDYSNDNASTLMRGPLSIARYQLTAAGNRNFGYFAGGRTIAGPRYSTIDRIDYSNDITLSTRSTLNVVSDGLDGIGFSGNNNFGFISGGSSNVSPQYRSSIQRLDYSNDLTLPSIRSSLSSAKSYGSQTGNLNFGYYGGGFSPAAPGSISTVDRIDYSNDTQVISIRGPLSSIKFRIHSTGNSNFGYFGGGFIPAPASISTLDRIDYSNDTQVVFTRGPLSSARFNFAASSSQAYGGAPNTTTDPLPTYIRAATQWNNSNTLDLPFKRVLGSFGYFGGGFPLSTVDRIDYSNDLATTNIRGPLSLNRYQHSATGNSNFGYYIAGNIAIPTVITTTIDRVDYSNDGATSLLRGNTTSGSAGRSFGATGNSNFGYIGNWSYVSTTNRIDYSNDNLTASIRGPLSSAKGYVAATGNSNFGYFGGGYSPGAINWSQIDRIDYSNDLSRSSVRGPLSLARYATGSTGNSNFGYFGGGTFFPNSILYSTIDRIDYSNDTQTTSTRGPLTIAKSFLAATGNSNFGYFGGGFPGPFSTVDRINYSNDTQTASVRRPLSLARQTLAASTNARSS